MKDNELGKVEIGFGRLTLRLQRSNQFIFNLLEIGGGGVFVFAVVFLF